MTFAPWELIHMGWAAFSDHLLGLGLARRTVTYYVKRAESADGWLVEHGSDLRRANASLIAAYASTLPNSHSTRGQAAAAFTHYWEWIDRPNPPSRALRVPPQPLMICRALEPQQASELKDTAQGWWPEGTAVLFGLYLALRREEIACAQWERFDPPLEWYRVTGKGSKTALLPVHPGVVRPGSCFRVGSGHMSRRPPYGNGSTWWHSWPVSPI